MTAVIDRLRFIDNGPTIVGTAHLSSIYLSPLSNTLSMIMTNQIVVHTFTGSAFTRSSLTNLIRTRCALVLVPYRSRQRHAVLVFCP